MYYLLVVILSDTVSTRKAVAKPPTTTVTVTNTTNTSPSASATTTTTTTTTTNKAIKIPAKKDEEVDSTGSWPLLGEMDDGSKADVNNKTKPKAEKTVAKVKEEEEVEGKNGKSNKKKGKCQEIYNCEDFIEL